MVSAAKVGRLAGLPSDDIAPVGTHIGKQVNCSRLVPGKNQGFVQIMFEEGKREDVPGLPNQVRAAGKLPRGSKKSFLAKVKQLPAGIKISAERFRTGYVLVNLKTFHAWSIFAVR
jgi:hypothetical protein